MNTSEIARITWYNMSDTSIGLEIGSALRNLRLQKNFSQEELSEKAGISRSAISEMENGKAATSMITIIQVLRALQQLDLLDAWKNISSPAINKQAKNRGRLRSRKVTTSKINAKEENEWEWL